MRASSGPAWWWRHAGIPSGGSPAASEPAGPPFPQSPLPVAVDLLMFGNWVEVTRLSTGQAGVYQRDRVTIARGRSSEAGSADPTRISFTLNNRDGRFSPRNPLGPYYGQIGRNTLTRVRVGDDVRGVAEISAWPARWTTAGEDAWVPVEAAGILRRLGQAAALRSAPVRYLPGTAPDAYWPMEDGPSAGYAAPMAGAGRLRPFTGRHPSGAVVTAPQWGQGALAPWLPDGVNRTGGAGLTILWAPVTQAAFTSTWTIDMIYNSGSDAQASAVDINPSYLDGATGWPQLILTPSAAGLDVTMNAEPESTATASTLYDSQPHHIRWTATQAAAKVSWVAYVDGVQVNAGTTAGNMTLTSIRNIGLTADASTSAAVTIGHVGIWSTPPALASAVAAAFGWAGETADARMTRLCSEESIPFAVYTDPAATPSLPVGPQRPAKLVELLAAAADVGGGSLYEPRDTPGLAYRTVASLYNQPAALTLDYTASDLSPPLEPVEDDQNTHNEITVTRQDGSTAPVAALTAGPLSNADPPGGVGAYPASYTLDLATDSQAADQAGWRLRLGTVDEARWPQVAVNLARNNYSANPALTLAAQTLDVGDVLTITNTPAWLPPGDVNLLVAGSVETLAAFERTITVNCVPAAPFTVGVYSASRYSSDGSTLQAAAAASATTLTVATPAGPVWSHADGDFDVVISGERCTVTAVTGGVSPQAFTVTRAVNGISKALPAAAAVELAQPAAYAL